MKFTSKHKKDSPTIHGLSFGAMAARADGYIPLHAVPGISIKLAREITLYTHREWHHVQVGGRVIEMVFVKDFEEGYTLAKWYLENGQRNSLLARLVNYLADLNEDSN